MAEKADTINDALEVLDDAEVALERLHKTCCVPGRSPRMEALGQTITDARTAIETDSSDVDGIVELIESAGAQIGFLQVGCCAPSRMPLYASMLDDLTTAQLTVKKVAGQGH